MPVHTIMCVSVSPKIALSFIVLTSCCIIVLLVFWLGWVGVFNRGPLNHGYTKLAEIDLRYFQIAFLSEFRS